MIFMSICNILDADFLFLVHNLLDSQFILCLVIFTNSAYRDTCVVWIEPHWLWPKQLSYPIQLYYLCSHFLLIICHVTAGSAKVLLAFQCSKISPCSAWGSAVDWTLFNTYAMSSKSIKMLNKYNNILTFF